MRAFWTSALCGLMLHAPAMAQESGQASDPPVAVENAQTEEPISVDPSTQPSEAIPGKPDPFAVLASATVGPVAGYTYFHRAGATLADQRADLAACRPAILAMTYPGPSTTGGVGYYDPMAGVRAQVDAGYISPGAAAAGGLAAAATLAAIEAGRMRLAELRGMQLNYENCMVVRGWSVMVLDNETGRALDRMGQSRLSERLETMVGAAAPLGTPGRQFENALAFRALDDIEEMSLSLRSLPDNYFARELRSGNNMLNATSRREERERALRARERAAREAERERAMQAAFNGRGGGEARAVDLATLTDLPEGAALILIGSDGVSARMVRMNAQEGDGADTFSLYSSSGVSALVVPAGDWRLVSLWTSTPATSHCLGAPVLRVNGGDVVYAGSFASDGTVDLSLDNPREALSSQPQLAERLRPGAYTNGSAFECGEAAFITAYEIPDAPFEEGYALGSRAPGRATP